MSINDNDNDNDNGNDNDNNNDNYEPKSRLVVPPFLKDHQNKSTLPPQKSTNNRTLSMSATYTSMNLKPIFSQSNQQSSNHTKRHNVEWSASPSKMDKRTKKYRDNSFFKNMFDKLLDNNDDDSEPVPNITSIGKSQHTPSTSKSSVQQPRTNSTTNSTFINMQAIDIIQNLEYSYEVDDTSTAASYIVTSYPDNSIKKKEKDLKKNPRDTIITNGENIGLELRHIIDEHNLPHCVYDDVRKWTMNVA